MFNFQSIFNERRLKTMIRLIIETLEIQWKLKNEN